VDDPNQLLGRLVDRGGISIIDKVLAHMILDDFGDEAVEPAGLAGRPAPGSSNRLSLEERAYDRLSHC